MGVNSVVRNRAKELAELLSDSEKIRTERRKSKQTKSKYTGVGNDESGFGGSGKKYGGFGSDDLSFGSYSGQVYGNFRFNLHVMVGDGGGFSSTGYSGGSDFQDRPSRSAQFEEYDEFNDGGARASVQRSSIPRKSPPKKEKPTPATPAKEADLFSFDDDVSTTTATTSNGKGKAVETSIADDDFDDFQSATGTSTIATGTKSTTAMPSLFSPPPVQSNPVQANIPNISSTSSFSGFGMSSTPIQQPARSPNPQTSFGNLTPSSTITPSTANYQPNYFAQPSTTAVTSTPLISNVC